MKPSIISLLLLVPCAFMGSAVLAAEALIVPVPASVVFKAADNHAGKQCQILNRTNPNFEQELLKVPPDTCVIVIGAWIIKTDFLFKPVEVVSPRNEVWRIIWKIRELPLATGDNWNVKVKSRGISQVQATFNVKF